MILVDFSQIAIAPIHTDGVLKAAAGTPCQQSKDIIGHSVLNSLRAINVAHREKYGELIIACDHKSWRGDYFSNYKYRRKLRRSTEPSDINWEFFREVQSELIADLQKYFPFAVVQVPGAEGDDVIGVMTDQSTKRAAEEDIFGNPETEPVLIVSSDRDNYQLHRHKHVKQWSPLLKKLVKPDEPAEISLLRKVLTGDGGDDIPNVRMGPDTFVNGDRQKPVTEKFCQPFFDALKSGKDPRVACPADILANYDRNRTLIDYRCTPEKIYTDIVSCYNESMASRNKSKMALMNYFASRKMNQLYERVGEFF